MTLPYEELRQEAYQANLELVRANLVTLTWGNASAADRTAGIMAIKPSGVSYETLRPADMVVLDIESGTQLDGACTPSSDTPTHLAIYRGFAEVHGVTHTHSRFATAWAQANRAIPALGTTHADHFYGPVPITRPLTPDEIEADYEGKTGEIIVECFRDGAIEPLACPGVLLPHHGPFTWGKSATDAVKHAIILEAIAEIAHYTLALAPDMCELPTPLKEKHYQRKHGPNAYYGQRGQ